MKRKGISPLIAAVLLIAFTMAVASLFAQWAPQLMEEAQGDTKNDSGEVRRCSKVGFDIDEDISNGSIANFKQDRGENAAGNVSITWTYDNGSAIQRYANIKAKLETINKDIGSEAFSANLNKLEVAPVDCSGAAPSIYEP